MRRTKSVCLAAGIALCLNGAGLLAQETQPQPAGVLLARHADLNERQIAFVYADKLWVADADGTNARQLEFEGGQLSHVRFAPDGLTVAFSGREDGNTDAYVISVDGSAPARRLTNHPASDFVIDWTPDGKSILFASSMRSPRATYNQLHTIPATGGVPKRLALPYGETAAYSSGGESLLFTYQRDFQEEAWKRYYGGRAPDLWSFNFASGETVRLTDHDASDSNPMAIGDDVYFLSERGARGRANLWKLTGGAGEAEQVTDYIDTDVRHPATDGRRIIFEAAGGLHVFDPASGGTSTLSVVIDRSEVIAEAEEAPVSDRIVNAALAPDGQVVIEARGEVFKYNARSKSADNLTQTPGVAERYPYANAQGDVAYLSDRGGEYSLYVRSGKDGDERKLADFGHGMRYRPHWSPDGMRIALFDYKNVLWLIDVRNGAKVQVDQGLWRYHGDLATTPVSWSLDGRWLTYARGLDNRNNAVFVYDTHSGERHQITSGAFNDFAPTFDTSGNYLLMLSHRHFQPTYGDVPIDATFTYAGGMAVAAIPLRANIAPPTALDWTMPKVVEQIAIDFDSAEQRLAILPPKPGTLSGLVAVRDGFVTVRRGSERGSKSALEHYSFGKDEPAILQEAAGLSIEDSRNDRVLARADTSLFIHEVGGDKAHEVVASTLKLKIDRDAEAQQMFTDAWRYARDFYYDPGLHGADWDKVRAQLEPLVAHVATDEDLTFVIREMMGELNGGHVYASATAPRARGAARNVGLLGVDFGHDEHGYRIEKIYQAGSRAFEVRSPLGAPSLGVHEGDYVLAVNGKALADAANPWAVFEGLANEEVELTVASANTPTEPRTIRVKTLTSERKLREMAWVEANRAKVSERSNGRVGYIYVPNTGAEGLNELMIQYRSQIDKDALIIDERFNTGGALGDRFVELLNRPPLVMFNARNSRDYPLPELAHRGPKAMLINGWSYSGGDGFPLLFKTAKIGPLIGKRTWGGLIGPGMRMGLINGGFVSPPPQRVYAVNGEWAEGNEGVRPNIDVLNDPGELAKGIDRQLETAIELMVEQIKDLKPLPKPEYQDADDWNPANREGTQ